MTTSSTFKILTAATVIATLLCTGFSKTEAHTAGARPVMAGASSAGGYRPAPIIRDHRKNPSAPFALPKHYHRHERPLPR